MNEWVVKRAIGTLCVQIVAEMGCKRLSMNLVAGDPEGFSISKGEVLDLNAFLYQQFCALPGYLRITFSLGYWALFLRLFPLKLLTSHFYRYHRSLIAFYLFSKAGCE